MIKYIFKQYIKLDNEWYFDSNIDGTGYHNIFSFNFEHNCKDSISRWLSGCNQDLECNNCAAKIPNKYITLVKLIQLEI